MNRLYWPTSGSNKFTLHHSTDLGNLSSKNLLTKVCQVNAICLHEYFFLQCSLPPTCCLHHQRIFVVWIRNIEYLVLSYTLSFTISELFHDRNCTYIDHEMIMLIAQTARTDTGLPKVDEFIEELIWQTHASWVLSIINSSLEREFFGNCRLLFQQAKNKKPKYNLEYSFGYVIIYMYHFLTMDLVKTSRKC